MILLAVITFSGLVTDVVGKIGGSVLQGSDYGTVIKNNRFKRCRQSPINYEKRAMFGSLAMQARALSDANRAICASNGALFTRATKGGPSTPYNWFSWYMWANGNRRLLGLGAITTTVIPQAEPNWDLFAIGDELGTTNWEMSGVDDFDNTFSYVIKASQPIPSGSAYRRGQMKTIQTGAGASGTVSILRSNYNAIFGSIATGQYCWFEVHWIYPTTGQAYSPRITKADAQ